MCEFLHVFIPACKGYTSSIQCVSISPDSSALATAAYDEVVQIWDTSSLELRATLEVCAQCFLGPPVTLVPRNPTLKCYSWKGHTGIVGFVTFSPNGRTLASSSWDSTLRLWEFEGGTLK